MSDWQPGDLALCVKDPDQSNVKKGGVYAVLRVYPAIEFDVGVLVGLALDGVEHPLSFLFHGDHICGEDTFVKITPGADIEGIEVERRVPVKGEPAHA